MVYFDYNGVCKVGTVIKVEDNHYVIKEHNTDKILNIPITQSLTKL